MILDYGNKQVIYYPAAAPFSWENSFDVTEANIRGDLFQDPDTFFGGLIEGGAVAAPVIERIALVEEIINAKSFQNVVTRKNTTFDTVADNISTITNYESINVDTGIPD